MYDFNYWATMAPMKYFDKKRDDLSATLQQRYDSMVENTDHKCIATVKWDGEWTMFIKWDNQILIRSRSISKVTGAYGDKTAHLPHLVAEMDTWPDNTVMLGEVCWGEYGTVSTDVGTILRCKPDKAVERQKDRKLVVKAFDLLAYAGAVFINSDYGSRYALLDDILSSRNDVYFSITPACPDSMTPAEFADEIINQGGEGAVIQLRDNPYMPGTRTAWKTLKLKQKLPHMELKVVGVLEPNKEYNGDCIETWKYWEQANENNLNAFIQVETEGGCPSGNKTYFPVTKPYFFRWKNGITVELPDGERCDVASGLTDADREWLATDQAKLEILNGELYAEIQAMQYNTKGKLRHPALIRLREMDESMRA